MKVINDEVLIKILNELGISLDKISYYTSGKCSDLYHYDNKILKILKWYVHNDNIADVTDKFREKTEFISYLNNGKFRCLTLNQIDNQTYKVIEVDGSIYVVYLMGYLPNVSSVYDRTLVGKVLSNLHNLSRKYNGDTSNSWILEYESVYSLCSDERIKLKLKEYFDEISLFDKNKNNYGIIHYDSNKNNYVLSDKYIFMIDFDSICNGYYLMDVANYLFSLYNIDIINGNFMSKEEFQKLSISILNEYNFDYNDIDKLNLFINYRFVYMYSILINFINDNSVKTKIENIIFNEKIVLDKI